MCGQFFEVPYPYSYNESSPSTGEGLSEAEATNTIIVYAPFWTSSERAFDIKASPCALGLMCFAAAKFGFTSSTQAVVRLGSPKAVRWRAGICSEFARNRFALA